MDWLKLYTSLPDDEKLVVAGDQAGWHLHLALYVCGLCYCAEHETDGRIPKPQVPRLSTVPNPQVIAADLVRAGLWHDEGGRYRVNAYTDRQSSKEQLEAARKARSEGGKKGAAKRWGDGSTDSPTDTSTHSPTNAPGDSPTDGSTDSPTYGSSIAEKRRGEENKQQLGGVVPARVHEAGGNEDTLATLAKVRTILNEIPGEQLPLTELNDVQLLRGVESCPGVDPVEAARAAVARGRQNLLRTDAWLRELRTLRTSAERNRGDKPDADVSKRRAAALRELSGRDAA